MNTTSQNSRILEYLKSGYTLSALNARIWFRCDRLAARIYDLRSKGIAITTTTVQILDKRVARYSLGSTSNE